MTVDTKQTIKIISGGQTGVDRAALDAALAEGVSVGGWCPTGRRAEDGVIPKEYPLREMPGPGYSERTRQNVIGSDGTIIVYFNSLSGGTEKTHRFCVSEQKPCVLIDAAVTTEAMAIPQLATFIKNHEIRVLNVAGPRASNAPQAYAYSFKVVSGLLQSMRY